MPDARAAAAAATDAAEVPSPLRIGATVLLVAIAYVHLSLLVDILGLSSRLGVLFALDVLGFACAIAGILAGRRLGWALALALAAASAAGRLGATSNPGVRSLVMGGGITQAPSHALPTLAGVNALGDVSVVLELAVVVLAAYALRLGRGRARP